VFKYLLDRNRELQSRRAEEGFDGFTLIELLIVIVVIAILAATVIFALGGVTGSSAQAACNSDAKSVEVAVQAYKDFPGNNNAWPAAVTNATTAATAGLTGGSNPYLRTWPSNSHYTITTDNSGNVTVTPTNPVSGGGPANYDQQVNTAGAPTGCFAVQ
jgi:prepilin-type N-terminal cleavage/methylation domain-containing protein